MKIQQSMFYLWHLTGVMQPDSACGLCAGGSEADLHNPATSRQEERCSKSS